MAEMGIGDLPSNAVVITLTADDVLMAVGLYALRGKEIGPGQFAVLWETADSQIAGAKVVYCPTEPKSNH